MLVISEFRNMGGLISDPWGLILVPGGLVSDPRGLKPDPMDLKSDPGGLKSGRTEIPILQVTLSRVETCVELELRLSESDLEPSLLTI